MTFNEIEKKSIEIVSNHFQLDKNEVKLDSNFMNDLGADSLDTVELIMEFEKEFNIDIQDEQAENWSTLGKAFEGFIKSAPRNFLNKITSRVLSFRFLPNGKVEAVLKMEDGSWCYADGISVLPSSICVLTFSKWSNTLKELEDIINDPKSQEADLQYFFECYPELLAGNDYDVVLPQAVMVKDDSSYWKPDFVLAPKNQVEFSKIIDFKSPSMKIHKRPKAGHLNFSAKLWDGIMQVRDYSREFDKETVRERFKNKYNVDVYKPDLHLIAGRKWDMLLINKMRDLQRETQVKIEDWDSVLDRLKRNYQ